MTASYFSLHPRAPSTSSTSMTARFPLTAPQTIPRFFPGLSNQAWTSSSVAMRSWYFFHDGSAGFFSRCWRGITEMPSAMSSRARFSISFSVFGIVLFLHPGGENSKLDELLCFRRKGEQGPVVHRALVVFP